MKMSNLFGNKREWKEGKRSSWPFGIHISLGKSVPPCSSRVDAWFHKPAEHSTGGTGFRFFSLFFGFYWGYK